MYCYQCVNEQVAILRVQTVKVRLWVLASSTYGLCVFPNIFAIHSCKLT